MQMTQNKVLILVDLLKPPELKYSTFWDNLQNSFNFYQFRSFFLHALNLFSNIITSTKLVYLKLYLKGRAKSLINK